ncbi:radial spoke head 14 homolog [Anoplophora glabripennis]|uniref:radial spoke head 14 homolog n=1 Tax=Anoplophora glabripennis TaxID=217634 RepID=UPI000874205A|nr:radial spoke head 14 homolog [Anoplophora glabripennis]
MFSIYKNSYLQTSYPEINPRVLNRCVQKAREFNYADVHDLEPPFQRLVSEQPTIPVQNVDVTRRPLAFGRRAMPKLKRELLDKDDSVVIAALQSICDLCHDPEKGYEAVNLKIIDKMVGLALHDNPAIRERTANALQILARLADGKEAIVSNQNLLDNLQICVEDVVSQVRIQIAALLEMIARFWKTADVLVDYGFIPILLVNLINEHSDIAKIHLETLKSLMYSVGKCIALENDGFNIFLKLLSLKDVEIVTRACDCLTLLTTSRLGEKMTQEAKLLEALNTLLYDERIEVHTSAASTIMFCTIKTRSRIAASKIKGLAKRLIEIAKNRHNPNTQIFALKALLNICEHPAIRKEVKNKYLQDITDIQINSDDPYLKHYKDILLLIINWCAVTVF